MPEALEEDKKYTQEFPNAIFAATRQEMIMTSLIISFHKNITDYHRKWDQMRLDWKDFVEDIQSLVVSREEGEIKRFGLTHPKDVSL